MGKTAGLIPFIPVPSSSPLESLFYWICNCSCWLGWLLTHLFVGISNWQLVTFHSFPKSGSTNTPWYTEKTSSLSRLCTPNLYFFVQQCPVSVLGLEVVFHFLTCHFQNSHLSILAPKNRKPQVMKTKFGGAYPVSWFFVTSFFGDSW